MKTQAEQYITDREDNRVAVVLELYQYDEVLPFAQALREVREQGP